MLDNGLDFAAGAQGKVMHGIGYDALTGYEAEAGLLDNSGDEQLAFHEREMVADTDACTGAERDVGVMGQLFLALRAETLRIEDFRLWEVLWPAVQCIWGDQNICPFGNTIVVNNGLLQRLAENAGGRRIEAHGLFKDLQTER